MFQILFPTIIALALVFPVDAASLDTAVIQRVVDGDTLKIHYKGQTENIRLIGVDAPESSANKKAQKDARRSGHDIETLTAMGKEATNYVERIVRSGDEVRLEFDVQHRDRYGRLLCYVYLSDGKMLNEEITKAGYAQVMTYPPNVKYQEKFTKAYKETRENKRGLWK